MSIESLTKVHQVLMEQEVVTVGAAMGLEKKYAPVGDWLDCRIVPRQMPQEKFSFQIQSYEHTHTLYFSFNPQADERMRFTDRQGDQYYFKGRKNPDQLNRFFKVYVDFHSARPKVN